MSSSINSTGSLTSSALLNALGSNAGLGSSSLPTSSSTVSATTAAQAAATVSQSTQQSLLGNLNSNSTGVSADVLARVTRSLSAQSAQVPKLNAALTTDRAKLSGLGQLQSALGSLQDVLQGLRGSGITTNASSSESKVLTAISSADASAGTYSVQVNQLAQSARIARATPSPKARRSRTRLRRWRAMCQPSCASSSAASPMACSNRARKVTPKP